jgi:YVTN family beta-propeller protein
MSRITPGECLLRNPASLLRVCLSVLVVGVLFLSSGGYASSVHDTQSAQGGVPGATTDAREIPTENFPKILASCQTPNPGGYGYIWPEAGAYDPANGFIYVSVSGVVGGGNFPAAGNVTVIAPPCKVVANVHLPFDASPGALAYDPSTQDVWVTDSDFPTLYLIHGSSIVSTLSNPGWCGTAFAIAFDPFTKAMMVANCDNTVSVFSGHQLVHVFTTGFSLSTSPTAFVVTGNNEIFVANWGAGDVAILNASNYQWIREVGVGYNPEALVWDSYSHEVIASHVSENGHDYLVAIDPYTNTAVQQIPVLSTGGEWALGYSASTRLILSADISGDVFATNTAGVSHQAAVERLYGFDGFTYDPVTGDMYALNVYSAVYVLS